jgi:GNAT superfamily N-acetyltransferase
MPDICIRPAEPTELAGMLELYRHLNPDDPAPDLAAAEAAWSRLCNSDLVKTIVAEGAGRLISSCTLVIVPNLTRGARSYGLIENVVTHRDHRRTGLGRAVLSSALDAAWQAGCYKVMLATGSRREETLRFYEGAGFVRGARLSSRLGLACRVREFRNGPAILVRVRSPRGWRET